MPIEIAAAQGWQECVEVLFPVTTPLARVADWSTAGIIQHVELTNSKPQDENEGSDFEAQGDDAFRKSDYAHALTLYTTAAEINPDDSTLYAKRSLCLLHTGDKGKALDDAKTYKDMQPDLSKSCYAQGAALILVKEYGRAIEALMSGLNLDFGSKPTDKGFSGEHP
ncbi:small glutamine-rich tetratricopeptide repeat-containing protein 2-like isoform X1 [Phragmites australis]|uniref:small glutamine-rich tetratricopeptide repeat-containing protein 2-like isoform X1 n=1 Tax=Phragmites australis TaxID=29695 RepID=UPI002D77D8C9|nr:small glutamine-rich tetratricopeptide repeat-containing protein 2-like isoform X1 [Phragmites australis]